MQVLSFVPVGCQRLEVYNANTWIKCDADDTIHKSESMTQDVRLRKVWIGEHGGMR